MLSGTDRSSMIVFPAHAGMSLSSGLGINMCTGFPRSRGDEPLCQVEVVGGLKFSPLTRG